MTTNGGRGSWVVIRDAIEPPLIASWLHSVEEKSPRRTFSICASISVHSRFAESSSRSAISTTSIALSFFLASVCSVSLSKPRSLLGLMIPPTTGRVA